MRRVDAVAVSVMPAGYAPGPPAPLPPAYVPVMPKHPNGLPDPDDFRVEPVAGSGGGHAPDLSKLPSRYEGDLDRDEAEAEFHRVTRRMAELQEHLYAENKRSLLIVLQAMDAAGKDSTVRHVFSPLNAAGCHVTSFKAPSKEELEHDFLWRIHDHAPRKGNIAVFNRSHYEDVLIVRVKGWVEKSVWQKRYDHINHFEDLLIDSGTRILKFYLHISKDYQKERLQRRLDRPDKHWKFNPEDLLERAHWDDYQKAFEDCFAATSTEAAPWFIIPSERRWYRNLAIARTVLAAMEDMDPQPPEPTFDPSEIVIE